MLEDASRRADNRAMITGARAMAASLAFNECDKPDWDEYAAALSDLLPEAARRWERTLESHTEAVQKLADAMAATAQVRAGERWGLNSVEVLNSNNRTTVGSANNSRICEAGT